MIKLRKKIIFSSLALIIMAGALWFFIGSNIAHALDTGLNFATGTGLASVDPRVTVAKIIRIILGFLGIIGVGLIMYAGFVWMTAKGEEEKIEKAKKIMISAAIGLVIVLGSFGIASYVIGRLSDATGGGSSGGACSPACSSGQYCCNGTCKLIGEACNPIGGGGDSFLVTGTTPAHQANNVIRNVVIRFRFNDRAKETSVTNNSFTVKTGGTPIEGSRVINGNYIEFTPITDCDPPHEALKCFPKNTAISVEAKNTDPNIIISVNNKNLICGGTSRCILDFTTGEIIDTEKPQVNVTSQQVCKDTLNSVKASSLDDSGVSKIDFFLNAATEPFDSVANNGNPSPFNAEVFWDSTGYQGTDVTFKATAHDLDLNNASAEKKLKLAAKHCCNGSQDEDETGKDCGGKDCLACIGQACAADIGEPGKCSNDLCQSGLCRAEGSNKTTCEAAGYPEGTTNCCLCNSRPTIDWVSPVGGYCSNNVNDFCRKATEVQDCGVNASCILGTPNGATKNFVTIAGSGFGTARGKVFFYNGLSQPIEAKLANDPGDGNPNCNTSVWKDNQIIALVPSGLSSSGKIVVENASGASDATNDNYGSLIGDFVNNTISRPGICSIDPTKGKMNVSVQYEGLKLTAVKAYYGNLSINSEAPTYTFNNPTDGIATVPNITSGQTTTFVSKDITANYPESNYLLFTKENEPYEGPVISSVDPLTGPVGQYVTIRGSGFGASRSTSKIFFGPSANAIEADYAFPDVCAESIWSDKQIVVKVPNNVVVNSSYKITIQRTGFADADSGSQTFSASAGSPNPGICSLQPILGQPNSEVILWGEYFGSTKGRVKFYNNVQQEGSAIIFWDIDGSASGIKPWKVVTTVPQAAKTGPVRIVSDLSQLSNAFNFTVGKCTKDSDCGSGVGATCCADGLPEAGKCKSSASLCYGSTNRSVYQWRFSAGKSNQCPTGHATCGTVCCAAGCDPDPLKPNKCKDCRTGENQCDDDPVVCCNETCNGNQCPDPESCSGYSTNQCLDNYYCPNTGGVCSPYAGTGQPIVMGDCSDAVCLNKPGCKGELGANICHYESALNLCVLNNANACEKKPMLDGKTPRDVIKLNNQPVSGRCDVFSNNLRWHIDWNGTSCPTGWSSVNMGRTICVDNNRINGACTKCTGSLSCHMAGNEGKCVSGGTICKEGSTCDAVDSKCKKIDTGKCDCCCRKDHVKEDCCLINLEPEKYLDCEGDCGASVNGNLGMCTGCAVGGIPDDSLCNCTGSTGQFCDMTNNERGVCRSCENIASATDCSTHDACCVDGKNNNKCSGVFEDGERFQETEGGLFFCAYFECSNASPNNYCSSERKTTGDYTSFAVCDQSCPTAPIPCGGPDNEDCSDHTCAAGTHCNVSDCTCQPDGNGAGEKCSGPNNSCTETCIGYSCILPSGYNGGGMGAPGETCRCCCNPANPNSCDNVNPNLSCLPDKEPCTSQTRGLCCGCSRDSQCGNDLIGAGCSTVDGCCRSRPSVESRLPAVNATNVCRNTVIEATFDQKMDLSSFSGNVWLIGKFNNGCPSGSIVASAPRSTGFLASITSSFKKAVVKLLPFLIDKTAFAETTICYVTDGSVIGYNAGVNKSKVSFRLSTVLEANTDYYVVLQGDPALPPTSDNQAYYNSKISSVYKIGMVGSPKAPATDTFNSTTFKNAEIWSFKTGDEFCLLDKVGVTPSFQLFQRPSQEAILEAVALDRRRNPIQAINNVYSWSWDWSSDNKDIAEVKKSIVSGEEFKATAKSGNIKDAQTLGRAKATIAKDTHNNPSTEGQSREGVAQLRVFLCENPWPVYYGENAPAGYVWPWQDDSQKIELYYCRDKAGVGTIDDLPAIANPPVIPPGSSNRKICMFGTRNVLKPCVNDGTCGDVANSCLSEVFKEFFFFRENEPGIPNISGTFDPAGGKVNLTWPRSVNATRYKVYYGLNSGQYILTADVPGGTGENVTKVIDGLVNGLTYYFAVTALSDKNQESIFSNELALKPTDTTPPAIPGLMVTGGRATNGNAVVNLFWNPVPGANSYIAYIGLSANSYALSTPVRTTPQPNKPNHTFTSVGGGGLNISTTYHLTVKSVDQYGNTSSAAADFAKTPNEPYLLNLLDGGSALLGRRLIVKWLPFTGALGYNIYYGPNPNPTGNKITVGSNVFSRTTPALADGTYYFVVKAITQANPEQETSASNERTVTVTASGIN